MGVYFLYSPLFDLHVAAMSSRTAPTSRFADAIAAAGIVLEMGPLGAERPQDSGYRGL